MLVIKNWPNIFWTKEHRPIFLPPVYLEIVKPMLTAFPTAINALGPHGFTLLHHAEKGGDEALEVKEYLVSLGAKEKKVALY